MKRFFYVVLSFLLILTVVGTGSIYAEDIVEEPEGAAPVITFQPEDGTVLNNQYYRFQVEAVDATRYRWECSPDEGQSWHGIGRVDGPVLLVKGTAISSRDLYRCTVSNQYGSTVSEPARLTVILPPIIQRHPSNKKVVLGNAVTFVVEALDAVSYQWEYSKDGGKTWKVWAGRTEKTLTTTGTTSNDGCLYRCKITNVAGTVVSNPAKLTVYSLPEITTQPGNVKLVSGKSTELKVAATGKGLSYQWEYSQDGGYSWRAWSGKTSPSLKITAKSSNDGCLYRCVVTNFAGSTTSKSAKLTVIFKPTISKQPSKVTVVNGKKATFTVTASGVSLKYQWQVSKDGGSSWSNLSGKTSASLSVTGSKDNNGYYYRCKVSNSAGSVTSSSAKLTVLFKPTITTQPKSAGAVVGEAVTFKVVASGSGLSYQWQYSSDGGSTWTNMSGKTSATLKVTVTDSVDGYKYRCKVTNKAGTVTSSSAKLSAWHEFILNTHSGIYHRPSCSAVSRMSPSNKRYYTGTASDVEKMGYRACKLCHPG